MFIMKGYYDNSWPRSNATLTLTLWCCYLRFYCLPPPPETTPFGMLRTFKVVSTIFYFHPIIWGGKFPFWLNFFQSGVLKPPTSLAFFWWLVGFWGFGPRRFGRLTNVGPLSDRPDGSQHSAKKSDRLTTSVVGDFRKWIVLVTTLQETNISPKNAILKMMFLFPRWDMLIPWRVVLCFGIIYII